jgi:hypothetical protein
MVHNRECPKCGKIVEWTRGEEFTTMIHGKEVKGYRALLICPEHGEFEPRAHEKLAEALERVAKNLEVEE